MELKKQNEDKDQELERLKKAFEDNADAKKMSALREELLSEKEIASDVRH